MKKSVDGSALLLVLCITAALSTLFLTLYRRSALVLLAAVEHERAVKRQASLDALMRYALIALKKNWGSVVAQGKTGQPNEQHFSWELAPGKEVSAYCIYHMVGERACAVEVGLEVDHVLYKLSCRAGLEKGKLAIGGWREG